VNLKLFGCTTGLAALTISAPSLGSCSLPCARVSDPTSS
jgi:hypothetical protein